MTIRYLLTGGRSIPGHDERLEIDGGRFRLRRTTGGTVVGRFSGELPPTAARSVDAAADAVRGSTSLHLSMSPGASRESIEADGTRIEGDLDDAPEAWSALVERLRDLVERLVDSPEAAIALEVDEDGRGARLVQRGSTPVDVDLSETRIAIHAWHGYYEPAGSWERGPLAIEAPATAEPGWRAELPFDHDLPTGDGFSLQVEANFAIRDDDGWRPVGAARVPVIDPPR